MSSTCCCCIYTVKRNRRKKNFHFTSIIIASSSSSSSSFPIYKYPCCYIVLLSSLSLTFYFVFFFRAPGRLCRFEEKWRDIRNFRHINDARLILKRKYTYSISSDHFWSAEGKENHLIKKRDSCIDVDVSSSRRRAM